MVSKHSKALHRRQARGTTYKLVHRSYDDTDRGQSDGDGMLWVKEADLRRNHTTRRKGEGYEDYCEDKDNEWADNDTQGFYEEDEDDHVDASHTGASQSPKQPSGYPLSGSACKKIHGKDDTYAAQLMKEWKAHGEDPAAHAGAGSRQWRKQEESAQEVKDGVDDKGKLFDDEMECEVTDDFLRQLVFGGGDDAEDNDAVSEMDTDVMGDEDGGPDNEGVRYGIPQEAWRLLTEEEKAGVRTSNARGAAFGRSKTVANAKLGIDAVTAQPYPVHDVTQRAIDRQFTEIMQEFDVDVHINDAYTDDPRTRGALPMDKYMGALKEFVVERAGVDYSTSEPAKNKGFIRQLELLTYRAGVFDTDSHGGMYKTTMASEKKERFAKEFRRETERIRAEAALRLCRKAEQQEKEEPHHEQEHRKAVAFAKDDAMGSGEASPKPSESPAEADICSSRDPMGVHGIAPHQDNAVTFEPEEEEEFRIAVIKSKDKRLDCETAVSVFSTYFNQPNVILPTAKGIKKRPSRKDVTHDAELKSSDVTKALGLNESSEGVENRKDGNSSYKGVGALGLSTAMLVPVIRSKDETKEEKRMRRQTVKMAQRERRQEKSALKKAYQAVGEMEKRRAATSQASKRTVHFL